MIGPMSEDGILQDQIEYYRARAGEYDEWWFRTGRYDRGPRKPYQLLCRRLSQLGHFG